MMRKLFSVLILLMVVIGSCQSGTRRGIRLDTTYSTTAPADSEPDYSYKVDIPREWTIRDTTLSGIKLRFIIAPRSLDADWPRGNILVASMEGRDITDFAERNMNYLKLNLPGGTSTFEKGDIETKAYKGLWFTYIRWRKAWPEI